MAMKIDPDTCTACGDCKPICPTKSISEGKVYFSINPATCNECEGENDTPMCENVCPSGAILAA